MAFTGIFIERIHKGFIYYYNNCAQGSWHGVCNTATNYSTQEEAQKDLQDLICRYPEDQFRIFKL